MNAEAFLNQIETHGYIIIVVLLFFGIVGIPSPEESFIFFLGILVSQGHLGFIACTISMILGAFTGMIVAYLFGRQFGFPVVQKFGKYVWLTEERFISVQQTFKKHGKWAIVLGFFLPGARQLSPYVAGTAHFSTKLFVMLSMIGSICWVMPYFLIGYFLGTKIEIPLYVLPLLGCALFAVFIIGIAVKTKKVSG